jgi:hypothetical protein
MVHEHVHQSEGHLGYAPKARPDDTPPRNRVIFGYTVLTVVTLIALKFVFDSYLDVSRTATRREHIADSRASRALAEYRRRERERLESGSMPVERAMRELGRRGRLAFPLIRPTESTDRAARVGWQQLPRTEAPAPAGGAAAPPATGERTQGAMLAPVGSDGAVTAALEAADTPRLANASVDVSRAGAGVPGPGLAPVEATALVAPGGRIQVPPGGGPSAAEPRATAPSP